MRWSPLNPSRKSPRRGLDARRGLHRHRASGWERCEDRALLSASTYTVNALTDTGAGSGTTGDLRYAITQADANPGSTIQFAVAGTIQLNSTLPDLSGAVTIAGPGASALTVQGRGSGSSGKFRVVQIDAGSTVAISGLTLANGSAASGGAINTLGGTLSLFDCTFTGNSASSEGGAIVSRGPLTISNCTFSNNMGGGGAALENDGTGTVIDSTFASNAASFGGGGIDNLGTLIVAGCTFTRNSTNSIGRGGGIENYFARMTVVNSTFDGNSAGVGGGIENYYTTSNGTVFTAATLINVTITGSSNYGIDVVGGDVKLYNTIVAADPGGDVNGLIDAVSTNNLIGDGSNLAGIGNGSQGNLVGTSAHPINSLLGTLAGNGGPTQTDALLAGSPAIGAGTNTVAILTDQRGAPRAGLAFDMGAYQHNAPLDATAPTVSLQATDVNRTNAGSLNPYNLTLTFADNVAVEAARLPGAVVQVAPPGGGPSIPASLVSIVPVGPTDAPGDAATIVVTYQITPPGGSWTAAPNGTYGVTLGGPPVTDLAGNAGPSGTVGTFRVSTVDLTVASFAPTASGFTASFSAPLNLAPLNLYGTASGNLGPADVTLVGAGTGPVFGSLIVDPTGQTITFVRTGGVLAPDTYTLTLRSAASGFVDTSGDNLDGDADGTPGGNYTTTFTVAPSSARVISVPDFARGPGQPVNLPATASGLPLTIGDGTGVTSIRLTLAYNPALLTITGANLGASAPAGASVTLDTSTPGSAVLVFTSPTALPAGRGTFATLAASVPASASYKSAEALALGDIALNGGAVAAVGDATIHAVAYLGDVAGLRGYSGQDVTLLRRVLVGTDSGFAAFPLIDPTVVGDITSTGSLNSQDVSLLRLYLTGGSVPQIPDLPGVPPGPRARAPRALVDRAIESMIGGAGPSSTTGPIPAMMPDPGAAPEALLGASRKKGRGLAAVVTLSVPDGPPSR